MNKLALADKNGDGILDRQEYVDAVSEFGDVHLFTEFFDLYHF